MNAIDELTVRNTTASSIELYTLGYVIAPNATKDLFDDDNAPHEVFNDEVRQLLTEGSLIVVTDQGDLPQEQSILIFDNENKNETVTNVRTYEDLLEIANPLNEVVYVRDSNVSFFYENGSWTQCGEEEILREGLALGKLYVNQLRVG